MFDFLQQDSLFMDLKNLYLYGKTKNVEIAMTSILFFLRSCYSLIDNTPPPDYKTCGDWNKDSHQLGVTDR